MVGDEAEQRRHQDIADVGAGHLNADEGLGILGTEVVRGGVDDTGIDGSTAHTQDHQPCEGGELAAGDQQEQHADADNAKTHADHGVVRQLHGDKAIDKSANGDTQVKQTGEAGSGGGIHPPVQNQIAGGPQACGLLQSTVAEKGNEDLPGTGDRENLRKCQGLGSSGVFILTGTFPQGQREKQDGHQKRLDHAYHQIAVVPNTATGEDCAHDIRTHGGTDAPHTMEPAHVVAFIVQRHIIVQCRVYTAGTQTVRDGPQPQRPEGITGRKAKEGCCGQGHTDGGDFAGTEAPGQPVAQQAGYHGTCGNGDENNAGSGYRNPKLGIDRGPGGTQQGVRQAKADE